MIDIASASFPEGAGVAPAMTSGPTSGAVKEFLSGKGPALLFVAHTSMKSDSPRDVAGGAEGEKNVEKKIACHAAVPGQPFADAGLAESGRLVYFLRDTVTILNNAMLKWDNIPRVSGVEDFKRARGLHVHHLSSTPPACCALFEPPSPYYEVFEATLSFIIPT